MASAVLEIGESSSTPRRRRQPGLEDLAMPSRGHGAHTGRFLPRLEYLEERIAPTTTPTNVDDNWAMIVDTAPFGVVSVGDIVQNNNDALNPGTIIATYGVDGFGTITTGPATGSVAGSAKINDAIAGTTAGGTVNILDGTYTEAVNVNKTVSLNGRELGRPASSCRR